MADLLTLENATYLLMLCFLQAVLGFDNLLYISIESKRAEAEADLQKMKQELKDTRAAEKACKPGTGDTIGTAVGS